MPSTEPMRAIHYTAYGDESDPGPLPIPPGAPVEGGAASDGDRHVIVVQRGTCRVFELYRAFPTTVAQNKQRAASRLTLPVLAIGGALNLGEQVANAMTLAADDVQSLVIPGSGHWVAEEAPEETLAALTAFLAT